MPLFLWVIWDFDLSMETKDGAKMTEDEYLSFALEE